MNKYPDFIIIGAMKCATTSLHDLLALQNGVFMTEPKEPNYFSDDDVYINGVDWYESLYENANPYDLTGESSTHYTKLPTYPITTKRLFDYKNDVKIIYIIRHPIERLISQYIHEWTEKTIKEDINTAIDRYPRLISYSRFAYQLTPYIELFGTSNIQLLSFEYFIRNQENVLHDVCDFIGYHDKAIAYQNAHSNVSKKRERVSSFRDLIVYSKLFTYIRHHYISASYRNKIKQFWQMKGRPEISPDRLDRLELIFNNDLELINKWFDLELNCCNFSDESKKLRHFTWTNHKLMCVEYASASDHIGVVIIGRNEGERLKKSIESVLNQANYIVYVDSCSTDGSCEYARQHNVDVVVLDESQPMNMARGRNAGFTYLKENYSNIKYIQFIDGDCELHDGWLDKAYHYMENHTEVAIVSGRRNEKYPKASIYNQMIDLEWDTPVGEAKYCHGDAFCRLDALFQVGGFNTTMICGEEPEMCIRIRKNGWKIYRIDADMTFHDADIHSFSQWWMRTVRSGWGFAQGAAMHGNKPERHWVRETLNIWIYGLLIPIISFVYLPYSLIILIIYVWHFIKLYRIESGGKYSKKLRIINAFYLTIGKLPAMLGQLKFYLYKYKNNEIIDYKSTRKS
ncbi:Glycosyl transferase family 2 [Poriferisphaera corsica]|uniref:Glycosyl transferase family 2 n=1 Tax=Poriferisphaera corsica TaxID=2528020 RepID=A0A517YWF8_9BACT|nr:glycosyltransferase [Poriferisphaera corsica]QDU34539.1 Glycosyl transferase family 2 [Poriferisphaera corsica]